MTNASLFLQLSCLDTFFCFLVQRAKHLNVLPAPKKDTALIVPDRVIFEEQPSLELLASESKENQATVQDHWQGISPYELEKAIQRMAQSVSPQHRRQKPCSQIC